MKKIVIISVIVIALAVAAFLLFRSKGNEMKFRSEKVKRGDVETTVTATGTVNAVTTVLVGTQVSGAIKNIYADFNSPVKKGQLIALLDPAIFEAQVNQARAKLIGGGAGILIGISGSKILSMLAGWTTIEEPLSILLAFGFSGIVGIFFGFYPAYKASLLSPIDALRYE